MRTLFSITGLGIPEPTGDGEEFIVTCSECRKRFGSPDPGKHLGLNPRKGVFHCIRCGFKGRLDLPESSLSPGRKSGTAPETTDVPPHLLPHRSIPGFRPLLESNGSAAAEKTREYLLGRGVTQQRILERSVGLSPDYPSEIIFPFFWEGKIIAYAARDLWGLLDKTWRFPSRASGWPSVKSLVYGADWIRPGHPVVVVEGIVDALVCPWGAATQGMQVKEEQVSLIVAKGPSCVVVFPDGDVPKRVVEKTSAQFRGRGVPTRTVIGVPLAEDPASLGARECRRLIRAALNEGG